MEQNSKSLFIYLLSVLLTPFPLTPFTTGEITVALMKWLKVLTEPQEFCLVFFYLIFYSITVSVNSNLSLFSLLLYFLEKILTLFLCFFSKNVKINIDWSLSASVALPSPSSFFNCQTNFICWIAFGSASIIFVYLNQLLLIYKNSWYNHSLIKRLCTTSVIFTLSCC